MKKIYVGIVGTLFVLGLLTPLIAHNDKNFQTHTNVGGNSDEYFDINDKKSDRIINKIMNIEGANCKTSERKGHTLVTCDISKDAPYFKDYTLTFKGKADSMINLKTLHINVDKDRISNIAPDSDILGLVPDKIQCDNNTSVVLGDTKENDITSTKMDCIAKLDKNSSYKVSLDIKFKGDSKLVNTMNIEEGSKSNALVKLMNLKASITGKERINDACNAATNMFNGTVEKNPNCILAISGLLSIYLSQETDLSIKSILQQAINTLNKNPNNIFVSVSGEKLGWIDFNNNDSMGFGSIGKKVDIKISDKE